MSCSNSSNLLKESEPSNESTSNAGSDTFANSSIPKKQITVSEMPSKFKKIAKEVQTTAVLTKSFKIPAVATVKVDLRKGFKNGTQGKYLSSSLQ